MNAVLELMNSCQKLVRDVACLAAEGRLFQSNAPLYTVVKDIFVIVSMCLIIIRIAQIVRSNHITLNEFQEQIIS